MLISEILTRAKMSLRPCRQSKSSYYIEKGSNHLKISPLVNVQMIVDPLTYSKLDLNSNNLPAINHPMMDHQALDACSWLSNCSSKKEAWESRKISPFYNSKLDAHFMLGLHGLTFSVMRELPFEELIIRFDEAIAFAEEMNA